MIVPTSSYAIAFVYLSSILCKTCNHYLYSHDIHLRVLSKYLYINYKSLRMLPNIGICFVWYTTLIYGIYKWYMHRTILFLLNIGHANLNMRIQIPLKSLQILSISLLNSLYAPYWDCFSPFVFKISIFVYKLQIVADASQYWYMLCIVYHINIQYIQRIHAPYNPFLSVHRKCKP